ncbi:mitochondrial uncoupling protein 3-like [Mya arenaria]|uniref:mitochondrial uncoupling protein 3-like n=1 Tax=Mya arenaria TaxID=6604 RepID=UPI0022E76723|nr:mitochondrial uncoupling protein 3-like [Mya arenaria]
MTSSSSQPYRVHPHPENPLGVRLASAGIGACIADLVTYPLDMAKVRLQIRNSPMPRLLPDNMELLVNGDCVRRSVLLPAPEGMLGTLAAIARKDGFRAVYAGLTAGLQRQLCFSTIRIGLYDDVKRKYQTLFGQDKNVTPPVYIRIMAGLSTGALSVTVAQPTEVVKIRMQAAGARGGAAYTGGVLQAYRNIARTEGLRGLWRGYLPNVTRNSVTGVSELVTYDVIKEMIIQRHWMTDNFPCHVVSGFSAGFVATVVASPVDVVKTRYMSASPGEFRGVIHCATSLVQECGHGALYKGFVPSFIRFGTWNILTFVFYEQLQRGFTSGILLVQNNHHSA